MSIKILNSAYDDLKKGRVFYEKQASDLGDYFLDSLFSDIDSLVLYVGIQPKVFGFYRLLARRFPFAIYYKIRQENIIVYRVLDCRQSPYTTKKQLK
ncbi:MAG: type II toxin-antitoxin system RelE/ParE family toxin [Kangiellaceae bacterium]